MVYVGKVNELIANKLNSNINEQDKREYKQAEKENKYHQVLISLIESVYKREEKLGKTFLKELSNTILKCTLTDDLQISGMIHGLVINFTQSFHSIMTYFKDFVDFFQKTDASIEKVNQIFIINCIVETINLVLLVHRVDNNNIEIEGEKHYVLFNLIFFWLTTMKQNKTTKSDNILYLLIKTIKNSDFLLVLKIIYLGVLKFVIEKRSMTENTNSEVFDQLCFTHPDFFKIETLINENKNNTKFNNLNITFKEDRTKIYNFDATNLEFYERVLFDLIHKCEKKIIKYGRYTELEYLERRINLLFFENKDPTNNATIVVNEYLKYFKSYFEQFRIKFYRFDIIQDISSVDELYKEFKSMLNQVTLLRLIYIMHNNDMNIEASILLQYTRKLDYDLAYKLLKRGVETHNIDRLEYIWKITYFELLANIYYSSNKTEHLSVVADLIKRTSNHQFFKKHLLRKHFKILNFMKFIEKI
jgi:hypothetical protein